MSKPLKSVTAHCAAMMKDFTLHDGALIELCPHTDMWMRGAKSGQITAIREDAPGEIIVVVKLHSWPRPLAYQPDDMRPLNHFRS